MRFVHGDVRKQPGQLPVRRGAVAVAMVMALVLLQLTIVATLVGGARHQDLSRARVESARAFYAAEAGINMSARELTLGIDEDRDGAIGSISSDSNNSNNPSVGQSTSLVVFRFAVGPVTTIRSVATAGTTARTIQTIIP
ncbi:MAG: hypothetical protein H7210_02205 [Pyrinomonadaceae bacterium]|nr:hypothetical protein [Phycisphaerales bacterium]